MGNLFPNRNSDQNVENRVIQHSDVTGSRGDEIAGKAAESDPSVSKERARCKIPRTARCENQCDQQ